MGIDKVTADNFYKDNGDKTLQNWFLYEYSNILFSKIAESPELAAYRKKHNYDDISAFCVYYSKRLRRSIYHALIKKTSGVMIDARYVYEYYPGNSRTQTQSLLEAASAAWEEHIQSCSVCSYQCLTNGFERTDMFDNLKKTGWPTV
jgi:hypothetical protein